MRPKSFASMRAWGVLAGLLALAPLTAACDAELEATCLGGDGTCDPADPALSTSSSSSSGAGGGACDIDTPSGNTGEFPCDVEAVMQNCRRCHSVDATVQMLQPDGPVPFPLDAYEESQELYGDTTRWFKMDSALMGGEDAFMPLVAPKLVDDESQAMFDWIAACAPPRAPEEMCE